LKKNKIVILGGGFGGTYTFKALHKYFHGSSKVEIKLVNKTNYFLFTPLLHEAATGGVLPHHVVEPIRKVLSCCLNDFFLAEAKSVDTRKRVVTTSRGKLSYDYLVLALGSQANYYNIKGAKQHAFSLKTLEDAQKLKKHFIRTFEKADKTKSESLRKELLSFVIVGGGPTGVEIATEMSEFFRKTMPKRHAKPNGVHITLVQKQRELLPQFSHFIRETSKKSLESLHVETKLGRSVVSVAKTGVKLDNVETIRARTAVWVGGVKPNQLSCSKPLPTAASGKIKVNEYLQVKGYKSIYALGDNASFIDSKSKKEVPALAQVATRQASVVAHNIAISITGGEPKEYRYQHQGYLLSLGRWMAVGEIFGRPVKGPWVWWIYRTVYLSKLLSWRKRISVAVEWTINLFSPRDISEV